MDVYVTVKGDIKTFTFKRCFAALPTCMINSFHSYHKLENALVDLDGRRV